MKEELQINGTAHSEHIGASIKDLCTKIQQKNVDGKEKVACLELLVRTAKELGDKLNEYCDVGEVVKSLRPLLPHRSKYMRAAAVRAIRYLSDDAHFVRALWKHHCHFFISKMFERDPKKNEKEREQALKFMVNLVGKYPRLVPLILAKSLVCKAETPEEPDRKLCVVLLRDLVLRNPQVVAQSNGVRVLLSVVLEPKFQDLAESIVSCFLYLMDQPDARSYIRPSLDLQILFSPFSEAFLPKEPKECEERFEMSKNAILVMIKCWPGLALISSDDQGLRALIQALRLPGSPERKKAIFVTLIEIFLAVTPTNLHHISPLLEKYAEEKRVSAIFGTADPISDDSNCGNKRNSGGSTGTPRKSVNDITVASSPASRKSVNTINLNTATSGTVQPTVVHPDNIMNHYLAVIVMIFIQCGLVEVLIELAKQTEDETNQIAVQMLHIVFAFADMLLDDKARYELHHQLDATLSVDMYGNMKNEITQNKVTQASNAKPNSMLTTLYQQALLCHYRKPVDIDEVKIQVDTAMSDDQFQQMIKESGVTLFKDHMKWDWDKLATLFHGPLRIQKRLSEALKTKLCKRLISFFKPKKRRFSELKYAEENMKFTKLGKQMIELLLHSDEGCKFLQNCGFLEEIAETLQIELKKAPESSSVRSFSPEKIPYYMSREYFSLIGKFSSYISGIYLLQENKIFNTFYELTESTALRDDLCQLILKHMDYTNSNREVNCFSRLLLSKAMTSGSQKIRFFATLQLRNLLRLGIADFPTWGISLLKTQLNDEWKEIVRNTLRIVEEAVIMDQENLTALIQAKPPVHTLENHVAGQALLLRFLSVDSGFELLQQHNWIEGEMKRWKTEKNVEYVRLLDESLRLVFDTSSGFVPDSKLLTRDHRVAIVTEEGVCLPPHFYGEICKTSQGCKLVDKSGDVQCFLDTINSKNNLECRAALWALGHIGSSDRGFEFIRKTGFLEKLVSLAETSRSFSFRGTCLYILGIMSKSATVRDELAKLGWATRYDPFTFVSTAILPPNKSFLQIPEYSYHGSTVHVADNFSPTDTVVKLTASNPNGITPPSNGGGDTDYEIRQKILDQVSLLGNPVMQDSASKALKRMRQTNMENFCTPQLVFDVYVLITHYKYKLNARRFIHELFDNSVYDSSDFEYLDKFYPLQTLNEILANGDLTIGKPNRNELNCEQEDQNDSTENDVSDNEM